MDTRIGSKNLNVTAVEVPNRGEGGQGVKKKEQALSSMSVKQLRDVIRPKYEDTVAGFGKLGFCSALRIKLKAVKEMVSNLSLKAYSDTNASKKMEFMQSRLAFMKEFEAVADLAISGNVGGRFSDPETLDILAHGVRHDLCPDGRDGVVGGDLGADHFLRRIDGHDRSSDMHARLTPRTLPRGC